MAFLMILTKIPNSKKMNNIVHKICLIAVIAFGTLCASAKTSVPFNTEGATGFNALEHVLQKPLGNDSFPDEQKGIDKHFFIAGYAGSNLSLNNFQVRNIRPGLRLGGQIGTWFNPNHGLRLSGEAGLLSRHAPNKRTWFGSVKADWLINLSSLYGGFNADRPFELIGAIGLEYQRIRQNGKWGNEFGIGASLQCKFNVSPNLFLFVEPRLSLLRGARYDYPSDWRRFKTDLALNIGLGYRILTGKLRQQGATQFVQSNDDNLYFGMGAGIFDMMRNGFPKLYFKHHNPIVNAHIGKFFSSTSGLQVSMDFGRFTTTKRQNRFFATASLDYVLNLANALGGYRPDQTFQILLNAGASAGYVRGSFFPGIDAGITGMFRLSPNWGIYIQPKMYLFTRDFSRKLGTPHAPLASVSLGLRYTIGDFSRLKPESYEQYNSDPKHWFLQVAAGGGARLRGNYTSGAPEVSVGFGKRFTPTSSWRVGLDAIAYMKAPLAPSLTLQADYLSSLTTAMLGYDPNRICDFSLVLGAFAGIANYDGPIAATYGLKAGAQMAFRLNSSLQLFIEPQFLAVNAPAAKNSRIWVPEVRGLIGLKYNLGTPSGKRGSFDNAPYGGDQRNFIGFAAGPSVFSGSFSRSNINMTGTLDLQIGHWFSLVSGIRFTYGNDWIRRIGKTCYVGSARVDYLLNLTSLFERSDTRRFHIIGAAGVGLAFCEEAAADFGPMAYGGLQFRYNLNKSIDLHIEPGAEFWANRVIPNPTSPHRFVMTGRLALGASYRF